MTFDFALLFVIAAAVTGAVWALDAWVLAPRRAAAGDLAERREPILVEYCRAFFPIILIVLVFRSFVYEPFRIPSSSMEPTLLVGDFILVNKYTYGLRLPVINTKIVSLGDPDRGDVVVFKLPADPGKHYIKRLIGLPGDRVVYRNKQLIINDEPVELELGGMYDGGQIGARIGRERLGGVEHDVLVTNSPGYFNSPSTFEVPPGQYFVMGDNRDNSKDSRFDAVGMIPEKFMVGRAVRIWMNKNGEWNRIGNKIR